MESDFASSDEIARLILKIAAPSIESVCEDYRWLTQAILEGEMHFRRHGKYQLSTAAETMKGMYSDEHSMRRYMNGLLLSHLWWQNHIESLKVFKEVFIAGNRQGFSHLEIGPGHGLFLHIAAEATHCARAEGWDISPGAVAVMQSALKRIKRVRQNLTPSIGSLCSLATAPRSTRSDARIYLACWKTHAPLWNGSLECLRVAEGDLLARL